MHIIGFSGKLGTGKTTTAEYFSLLCEPFACPIAGFGDLIRRRVAEKYNVPLNILYHSKNASLLQKNYPLIPENGMTARTLLAFQADMDRAENPAFYHDFMYQTIEQAKATPTRLDTPGGSEIFATHFLVHDIRMPDEIDFLRNLGASIVRLTPYSGYDPGLAGQHSTETALDEYKDWDFVFSPEYGALKSVAESLFEYFPVEKKTSLSPKF